jgi:uncharacterized iron-regulated protein
MRNVIMTAMRVSRLWYLFAFSACGLIISCASVPPHPLWVSTIRGLTEPIGPEEILRLPEGDKISFSQLSREVSPAEVVFVGESHDQVEQHQIQTSILREFLKRERPPVIAMEMFRKDQQSTLDRWSQGELDEEEFLKEVQWDTTWGFDYSLYKPILDEARQHRLKVLGLNTQRELVRRVGQNGIEALSTEDRKKLPKIDLSDRRHRAYLKSIFENHKEGSAKEFESFYQAQCLWDEAMAETLAEFLKSAEGKGKTVLVFAGNGHIVFDFGIPNRLHRRIPLSYKTIVLKEWRKRLNGDFAFSGASEPVGDFLWITKPNPPEPKRPRIGVFLKPEEGVKGLRIEQVVSGSPAEKAGLRTGDLLLSVEGKEITKVKDIHDALAEKGWGKELTFVILREGQEKNIAVSLPPADE